MDISKEYILMCKMAEEIQASRKSDIDKWESEDHLFCIDNLDYTPQISYTTVYHKLPNYSVLLNSIWLPRQDQLQEIYFNKIVSWMECVTELESFYYGDFSLRQYVTMEQLWLGVVMIKKYNKNWNDEEKIWGFRDLHNP